MPRTPVLAALTCLLPEGIVARRRGNGRLSVVGLHRKLANSHGRTLCPFDAADVETVVSQLCDGNGSIPALTWPEYQREALRAFLHSPAAASLRYRSESPHARRPGSPTVQLNRLLPRHIGISITTNKRNRQIVRMTAMLPKGVRTPEGKRGISSKIDGWDQLFPTVKRLMAEITPFLPEPPEWPTEQQQELAKICTIGGGDVALPIPKQASKNPQMQSLPLLRQWLPKGVFAALVSGASSMVVLSAKGAHGLSSVRVRFGCELGAALQRVIERHTPAPTHPAITLPTMTPEVLAPLIAELVAFGVPEHPAAAFDDANNPAIVRLRAALPDDLRCRIGSWKHADSLRQFVQLSTASAVTGRRSITVRTAASLASAVASLSTMWATLDASKCAFIMAVSDGRIRLDLPWEQPR